MVRQDVDDVDGVLSHSIFEQFRPLPTHDVLLDLHNVGLVQRQLLYEVPASHLPLAQSQALQQRLQDVFVVHQQSPKVDGLFFRILNLDDYFLLLKLVVFELILQSLCSVGVEEVVSNGINALSLEFINHKLQKLLVHLLTHKGS